jgi:hypothetical protein
MFQLKQEVSEVKSSNSGITASNLRQVSATREVSGTSFTGGPHNYKWSVSANKWWCPQKSYMRLRCKLTKADKTTPLTLSDDVAPNMNLCGNLWQSCDFKIQDTTVCRVANNVAQVDTLKHRLEKSNAWNKTIGQSTNFWDEDFYARQNSVCSNGVLEDYKTTEVLKENLTGFNAGDTVEYKAGNTVELIFINVQSADLFRAGDLYHDYSNPITVPSKQVIESVVVSNSVKTFTLKITTTPVSAAATTHRWARVRFGGTESRRVSEFELIWKPPLSIFDYEGCLPCGNYELTMNPQNASIIQNLAIESIGSTTKPATGFAFSIEECHMYIQEVEGPNMQDTKYLLDLSQIRAQTVDFTTSTFSQRSFDVSPATQALTMAFQDSRVGGSDTRLSASKFRMYDDVVPFYPATTISNDAGLRLNRFYMSYGGINYPQADADPLFNSTTDKTTQRYVESMMQSEAYYDHGGAESIQQYHTAGSYYHQNTYKDGRDQSTRVTVYSGLSGTNLANGRVILFDHHTMLVEVEIENGAVKGVNVSDM